MAHGDTTNAAFCYGNVTQEVIQKLATLLPEFRMLG